MMTRQRQFWLLQTAAWLGYALENFLAEIGYGRPLDIYKLNLYDAACGFLLTLGVRAVLKSTWSYPPRQRLAWGGGVLVLAALIGGYAWAVAVSKMCGECKPPKSWLGYLSYFFGWLQLLVAWTGAYVGIKLARQLQAEKETSLQATAMAHQAQLRMLRYQLNPHFLFNTLNAISTLVLDGRSQQANGMVGALSSFLRYSLDSDPEQKVTLDQEIGAIQRYLTIEQLRFGDRLKVGILITPPAGTALVPSLILQPLIENAVKFGVSKREEAGRIEIIARVDNDLLEIVLRDNGPGSVNYRPERVDGQGVGLANTRERLRVLYGERQHFEISRLQPQGTEVRLQFPFEPTPTEARADANTHPDRRR
jgi:protein-S-isoprenylcysteine O-methyltransferase Ste14